MSSITRNEIINASVRLTEAGCEDVRDEVIQFITVSALKAIEPPPASLEDEAKALYPDAGKLNQRELPVTIGEIQEAKRQAHITCARMYTGEIERLKGKNGRMRKALEQLQEMTSRPLASRTIMNKIATEALKTP